MLCLILSPKGLAQIPGHSRTQLAPGPCPRRPLRSPAAPSRVDLTVLHAASAQSVLSLCPRLTRARPLGSFQAEGHWAAERLGWSGLAGPRDWPGWALSPEGHGPGFLSPFWLRLWLQEELRAR